MRGRRMQGRAAGNLREVAPRVSCAGNLRDHCASMAPPSARCINYAPDSARYLGEGKAAPAPSFGRGLSLFAHAHAAAVFAFLGPVSSCPPRPLPLFPRFSIFCPGPRARGVLLFGSVMLVAVSAFAFAHLGAWRPSSAVLRVSCEVYQGSAPAEHLRAVILAQRDAPRFRSGGAALLPWAASERLGYYGPPGKRKSGEPKKNKEKYAGSGATLPRCITSVARFWASLGLWVLGLWVCGYVGCCSRLLRCSCACSAALGCCSRRFRCSVFPAISPLPRVVASGCCQSVAPGCSVAPGVCGFVSCCSRVFR